MKTSLQKIYFPLALICSVISYSDSINALALCVPFVARKYFPFVIFFALLASILDAWLDASLSDRPVFRLANNSLVLAALCLMALSKKKLKITGLEVSLCTKLLIVILVIRTIDIYIFKSGLTDVFNQNSIVLAFISLGLLGKNLLNRSLTPAILMSSKAGIFLAFIASKKNRLAIFGAFLVLGISAIFGFGVVSEIASDSSAGDASSGRLFLWSKIFSEWSYGSNLNLIKDYGFFNAENLPLNIIFLFLYIWPFVIILLCVLANSQKVRIKATFLVASLFYPYIWPIFLPLIYEVEQ